MGARPRFRLGINAIIATMFLIACAVVVGALFMGWQIGWIRVQAREGLVTIQVEGVRSTSIQQAVITIKNVGNVKVSLLTVSIEIEKNGGGIVFEVYPEVSAKP